MNWNQYQIFFKKMVDKFLLINLFTVILFAAIFVFALIMQINGVTIFLEYYQNIWNPIIVPLISIFIISSLLSGIIAWLRRQLPSQEEDI